MKVVQSVSIGARPVQLSGSVTVILKTDVRQIEIVGYSSLFIVCVHEMLSILCCGNFQHPSN